MTVCNILFTEDAVAIYSDTLVYRGDDPVSLARCKVRVDPGRRFAWETRGSVRLGEKYDGLAMQAGCLDLAAEMAREWLARLTAEDFERHGSDAQRIILAGWSSSFGDLAAIDCLRKAEGNVTVNRLDRGVHLHPRVTGNGPTLPRVLSDRQMIAVAHAQKRLDDTFQSGLCIGGVLFRHVVTRDDVTEGIADLYAGYDADARRFGDPNAAEVAQWRAAQAVAVAA